MPQCAGCGNEVAAGLKFCTGCGRPVAQPADAGTARCARCGAPQSAATRFCTGCGSPMASPPPGQAQPPSQPRPIPASAPPGGIPQGMQQRPMAPSPPVGPPQGYGGPAAYGQPMGNAPAGAPPSGFPPAAQAAPRRGGIGGILVALFLLLVLAGVGVGGYLAYQRFYLNPDTAAEQATDAQGQAATASAADARTATRPGATGPSGSQLAGSRRTSQGLPTAVLPGGSGGTGNGAQLGSNRTATPAPERSARPPVSKPKPPSQVRGTGSVSGKITAGMPPPSPSGAGPAGWGAQPAPSPAAPASALPAPAPSPIRQPATPQVERPASGIIIWSGPLRKDTVITIDGESANAGTVRGALPGVPVIVETDYKDIGFAEMPGPSNGWKRISMRGRKNINVVVTLRWRALK